MVFSKRFSYGTREVILRKGDAVRVSSIENIVFIEEL